MQQGLSADWGDEKTVFQNFLKGTSKNSGSVRAGQRDLLQPLEWMDPKATPGPIYRGALNILPSL
jgi:hypothetical protein